MLWVVGAVVVERVEGVLAVVVGTAEGESLWMMTWGLDSLDLVC